MSLSNLSILYLFIYLFYLITPADEADIHLARATLCQAYNLIHQQAVRRLCTLRSAPRSWPPRATSLLVTLLKCTVETSSITARLMECVAKINLSNNLVYYETHSDRRNVKPISTEDGDRLVKPILLISACKNAFFL